MAEPDYSALRKRLSAPRLRGPSGPSAQGGIWREILHPRDAFGRFRDKPDFAAGPKGMKHPKGVATPLTSKRWGVALSSYFKGLRILAGDQKIGGWAPAPGEKIGRRGFKLDVWDSNGEYLGRVRIRGKAQDSGEGTNWGLGAVVRAGAKPEGGAAGEHAAANAARRDAAEQLREGAKNIPAAAREHVNAVAAQQDEDARQASVARKPQREAEIAAEDKLRARESAAATVVAPENAAIPGLKQKRVPKGVDEPFAFTDSDAEKLRLDGVPWKLPKGYKFVAAKEGVKTPMVYVAKEDGTDLHRVVYRRNPKNGNFDIYMDRRPGNDPIYQNYLGRLKAGGGESDRQGTSGNSDKPIGSESLRQLAEAKERREADEAKVREGTKRSLAAAGVEAPDDRAQNEKILLGQAKEIFSGAVKLYPDADAKANYPYGTHHVVDKMGRSLGNIKVTKPAGGKSGEWDVEKLPGAFTLAGGNRQPSTASSEKAPTPAPAAGQSWDKVVGNPGLYETRGRTVPQHEQAAIRRSAGNIPNDVQIEGRAGDIIYMRASGDARFVAKLERGKLVPAPLRKPTDLNGVERSELRRRIQGGADVARIRREFRLSPEVAQELVDRLRDSAKPAQGGLEIKNLKVGDRFVDRKSGKLLQFVGHREAGSGGERPARARDLDGNLVYLGRNQVIDKAPTQAPAGKNIHDLRDQDRREAFVLAQKMHADGDAHDTITMTLMEKYGLAHNEAVDLKNRALAAVGRPGNETMRREGGNAGARTPDTGDGIASAERRAQSVAGPSAGAPLGEAGKPGQVVPAGAWRDNIAGQAKADRMAQDLKLPPGWAVMGLGRVRDGSGKVAERYNVFVEGPGGQAQRRMIPAVPVKRGPRGGVVGLNPANGPTGVGAPAAEPSALPDGMVMGTNGPEDIGNRAERKMVENEMRDGNQAEADLAEIEQQVGRPKTGEDFTGPAPIPGRKVANGKVPKAARGVFPENFDRDKPFRNFKIPPGYVLLGHKQNANDYTFYVGRPDGSDLHSLRVKPRHVFGGGYEWRVQSPGYGAQAGRDLRERQHDQRARQRQRRADRGEAGPRTVAIQERERERLAREQKQIEENARAAGPSVAPAALAPQAYTLNEVSGKQTPSNVQNIGDEGAGGAFFGEINGRKIVFKPASDFRDYDVRRGYGIEPGTDIEREIASLSLAHYFGIRHPKVAVADVSGHGKSLVMERVNGTSFAKLGYPHLDRRKAMEMAVYNVVLGNTDRHGQNFMIEDGTGDIVAIDHALAFPTSKPRSKSHSHSFFAEALAGSVIPPELRAALQQMKLDRSEIEANLRAQGIPEAAINLMWERIDTMIKTKAIPKPSDVGLPTNGAGGIVMKFN